MNINRTSDVLNEMKVSYGVYISGVGEHYRWRKTIGCSLTV